jgi:hypothetical protein
VRWAVSKDGLVVLASETGVLELGDDNIERKGRLEPGRMFLVDTEKGRIVEDEEIKDEICRRKPYGKWLRENKIALSDVEHSPPSSAWREPAPLVVRWARTRRSRCFRTSRSRSSTTSSSSSRRSPIPPSTRSAKSW